MFFLGWVIIIQQPNKDRYTFIRVDTSVKDELEKHRNRLQRSEWYHVSYSDTIRDLLVNRRQDNFKPVKYLPLLRR